MEALIHPHEFETDGHSQAVPLRFPEPIQDLRAHLMRLADDPQSRYLRLDLGALASITGSELRVLVALNKQLTNRGGRLTLENVRPEVYRVFHITRLSVILNVRPPVKGL